MRIGIACDDGPPPAAVIDLLTAAGLPAEPLRGATGPALVIAAETTWLLAGGADVLTGCATGALDAAVVGKDVLLERAPELPEVLDLGVCIDVLVYATREPRPVAPGRARPRVATRYPRLTRKYFAAGGRQVEAVPFAAAALAPTLGLADGVVELRTRLIVMGADLHEREQVARCSARLVVGRAARTLRGQDVAELIARLRALERL